VNKSNSSTPSQSTPTSRKRRRGRALDATVDAIQSSLKKGSMVTLVGFGSFYVGKRNARSGTQPADQRAHQDRRCQVAKFRAGKALKDALN
jgi:DNA-binding protein HU-beta